MSNNYLPKSINVLNLIVIGLAILALLYFRFKFKNEQYDNGPLGLQQYPPNPQQWYQQNGFNNGQTFNQPSVQQGQYMGQYDYPINQLPNRGPESNLNLQPYMYERQLYPKIPYYPSVGQPCVGNNDCGATGNCQNGICAPNQQLGTVFNI